MMIRDLFTTPIYVKVYRNRLTVRSVAKGNELTLHATEPFTTSRLLVGEFVKAEALLKEALKKISSGKWLSPSPVILIQPMEMNEGGLSPIEDRVLRELAFGAGGRKVVVWEGKLLSDDEVIHQLK